MFKTSQRASNLFFNNFLRFVRYLNYFYVN
uniref:Uncharacterized protein n=1 Tax=Rhizophora mucronata TaxID=61149 RepID=A0A2P2NT84_RHIMU